MAINTNSVAGNLYSSFKNPNNVKKQNETDKENKVESAKEAESTKTSGNYGKTIGNAKLSKEAAAYYDKLKKQYGNMDFILVSKDQKASAQANAGKYANPHKTVVLIDEEKIERMATDDNYRKKYEGIIKNAASGLSQLKEKMEASGQSNNVLGYGMKVNDGGTASFFAIMKKSGDDQKARIEKKSEEKKAKKKEDEKKSDKKEREERLKESQLERKRASKYDNEDSVTIEANSIEELMQKISDYNFNYLSNNIETEAETKIGHNIDFRG